MENKKGSGIFLGVVSVATLIVAIIGATFAYFSASASSNEDINVKAYEFDMDILVELVSPENVSNYGGLIPMNPTATVTGGAGETNLAYAINTGANISGEDPVPCIDSNGHQVCALYKVTVSNNGSQQEKLSLSAKNVTNTAGSGNGTTSTPFKDLVFQLLDGDTEGSLTVPAAATSKVYLNKTLTDPEEDYDEANNPYLDVLEITNKEFTVQGATRVPAEEEGGEDTVNPGTVTFYFVIYLDDTADADQSEQMGASYVGQIILATGGNKLTGTFNLG